jgi:hypothetical protein
LKANLPSIIKGAPAKTAHGRQVLLTGSHNRQPLSFCLDRGFSRNYFAREGQQHARGAVMSEVKTSTVLVGAVTALVFGAFVVSIGLYLIDVGLR